MDLNEAVPSERWEVLIRAWLATAGVVDSEGEWTVDKFVSRLREHRLLGPAIMLVTPKNVDTLGIEPVGRKLMFCDALPHLTDKVREEALSALRDAAEDRADAVPIVQERFNDFVEELLGTGGSRMLERDLEASLVALCAVAGEHPLLIGPPGTGKSMLCRNVAKALRCGATFEYLVNRFTKPDELFGTYSLRELEFDRLVRVTRRFLPWAKVAFLDEIFKASGETLNSLLGLLEDRMYNNGASMEPCPLLTLIGASNELPRVEDDDMQPLYDRFLVRLMVDYLKTPDNYKVMSGLRSATGLPTPAAFEGVSGGAGAAAATPAEEKPGPYAGLLTQAVQKAVKKEVNASVHITIPVSDALWKFRQAILNDKTKLTGEDGRTFDKFSVSDRRWRKITYFLRLASWCRRKTLLCIADAFIVLHTVWRDFEADFETLRLKWFESFEECMRMMKDSEATENTSKWQLEDLRGATTATVRWLRTEDLELLHHFEEDPEGTVKFLRQALEQSQGRAAGAGGSGETTHVLRWVEDARRYQAVE